MNYYPPGRFKSINPLTTGSIFQKIKAQFQQRPWAALGSTAAIAVFIAFIVFWLRRVYTDTPIYERKRAEKTARKASKKRKKKPAAKRRKRRKSKKTTVKKTATKRRRRRKAAKTTTKKTTRKRTTRRKRSTRRKKSAV